jgi:hypothetical protein
MCLHSHTKVYTSLTQALIFSVHYFSYERRELEYNIRMELVGKNEAERWMKLAQDRVQWLDLVLEVLNLRVLLP